MNLPLKFSEDAQLVLKPEKPEKFEAMMGDIIGLGGGASAAQVEQNRQDIQGLQSDLADLAVSVETQIVSTLNSFDSYTARGVYFIPTAYMPDDAPVAINPVTNLPQKTANGWLIVITNESWIKQILLRGGSANNHSDTFIRTCTNGTWQAWRHVLTYTGGYHPHGNIYINSETGDDANVGTSKDAPIKSMERFFEMLNDGAGDIRGIITGGVVDSSTGKRLYEISKPVINNAVIHLVVQADDVLIKCTSSSNWVFYNCHINFSTDSGYTPVSLDAASGWIYAENTAVTLSRVDFACKFTVYGGNIISKDGSYTVLEADATNGVLQNTAITNTDPQVHAVHVFHSANIAIRDSLTFAELSGSGSGSESAAMLITHNSRVGFSYGASCTAITNKYAYAIYAVESVLVGDYSIMGNVGAETFTRGVPIGTGDSGGASGYTAGNGISISGNTISVSCANAAEEGNTLPISSDAVYQIVGNIESQLAEI